jgi:hypothetical protein
MLACITGLLGPDSALLLPQLLLLLLPLRTHA